MTQQSNLRESVIRAVDRGATAAEEIHRSIACIPLDLLEKVDGLEEAVDGVRKLQDRSISAVYDLVRGINHEVGRVADDLLKPSPERRRVAKARKTPVRRPRKAPSKATGEQAS
jgi:hypothetical protein